jgi:predicted nucleotidyltransferase
MPPDDPDIHAILDTLTRHEVRFVVIGGQASIHWGSPFPTEDVDITPSRVRENLDRLSAALTELGARVRTSSEPDGLPFTHTGASLADAAVWNLLTTHGDLDISFVPNGTTGYDDLVRDAAADRIHGVQVRVASLADIIRSKQAANRPKDQRVLPTLREILASRNPRNRPTP